jgi:hypothetical protein
MIVGWPPAFGNPVPGMNGGVLISGVPKLVIKGEMLGILRPVSIGAVPNSARRLSPKFISPNP